MPSLACQGGPGSVCPDLPPTLLPHAIAAAAPPRDRGRSLLLASAIYLALAGAGILFCRAQAALPPTLIRTSPPPTLVDVLLNPVAPVVPHPTLVAGPVSGSSPVLIPQAVQRLSQDLDPPLLPSGLPSQDLSHIQPAGLSTGAPSPTSQSTGSGPAGVAQAPAVEMDMSALRVLHQVDPVYPAMARAAHVQGAVVLLMTIDAAGIPTDVQVLTGHPAFREGAVRAARQWRFEPARVDGQAVPATFRLTLNFRLK